LDERRHLTAGDLHGAVWIAPHRFFHHSVNLVRFCTGKIQAINNDASSYEQTSNFLDQIIKEARIFDIEPCALGCHAAWAGHPCLSFLRSAWVPAGRPCHRQQPEHAGKEASSMPETTWRWASATIPGEEFTEGRMKRKESIYGIAVLHQAINQGCKTV
jgi:hypothetical protein